MLFLQNLDLLQISQIPPKETKKFSKMPYKTIFETNNAAKKQTSCHHCNHHELKAEGDPEKRGKNMGKHPHTHTRNLEMFHLGVASKVLLLGGVTCDSQRIRTVSPVLWVYRYHISTVKGIKHHLLPGFGQTTKWLKKNTFFQVRGCIHRFQHRFGAPKLLCFMLLRAALLQTLRTLKTK